MKKLRASTKSDPSIPVSGMADIAFLLIIFFMVTTSFMKDKGMSLELPKSEEDKNKKQMKEVTVTVSENQIVLNKDPVKIGELQGLLEEALDKQVKMKQKKKKKKKSGKDSEATESKRIVILKTVGEDIPYQKWVRVVDIIKLANGTITILIEEEANDGSAKKQDGGSGGNASAESGSDSGAASDDESTGSGKDSQE